MAINREQARQYLKNFDFSSLFIETLGWNQYTTQVPVTVNEQSFNLRGIAEKCQFAVLTCDPLSDGSIPDYQTRLKIDRQVAKIHFEHFIIYYNHDKTIQRWQLVKRQQGKPPSYREHIIYDHQTGEPLIQKLCGIATTLEEEEFLTLTDITGRIRAAFDVEKVTKRFYDRFKKEHDSFLDFIEGIPDEEITRWYASVMINRLMFIYFIQKKGFLDGDVNYLKNKLGQSHGSYYSNFLRPLFFKGFAEKPKERSDEINNLLGEIPYLNGGIFLPHPIEETHADITIQNEAFEKLFTFFDQYRWHLDERPLRNDNEINPDVLGYIFEKYINQKQMGAYYTKEDITDYISKNTIIPRIFDMARDKCRIAFEGEQSVWNLLRNDPDRYIYDSVRKGTELELPPEIAIGIKEVSKRTEWNKPAPEEYALPTEIWRETIARHQRYEEVKSKLLAGEVNNINDLITYNLDIRQFAQDVITNSEGSELLRAFYHAIEKITVLDPTCGSGAFLFAALNILEPLYEACLERMQVFLDELDASGEKHHPEKYSDFRTILTRIEEHPTPKYYIYKYIILNNLFGVDIMEEAIEICKLRLFLKLVAQVENVDEIEPLPDIDFNIRSGNTLVGFTKYEELLKTAEGNWVKEQEIQEIEQKAQDVDNLFNRFREQQEGLGGNISQEDKVLLQQNLSELENKLNEWLAQEYEVNIKDENKYKNWLKSHKPFHWFIDFHEIMKDGGFDVIIGNPPYVEYSKVNKVYTVKRYNTEDSGNLYAFIMEISLKLLCRKGCFSMIVPLSLATTKRIKTLQNKIFRNFFSVWLSHFDVYPCKLFEGAKQRLTIAILRCNSQEPSLFTTCYNRWRPEERKTLVSCLNYGPMEYKNEIYTVPKINCEVGRTIFNKISDHHTIKFGNPDNHVSFFVHRIPYNYIKCFNFVPFFWNEIDGEKKSEDYKPYRTINKNDEKPVLAILNSNLFFWYWYVLFEGYHCGKHEIYSFPVGNENLTIQNRILLEKLSDKLMEDLQRNKYQKKCNYRKTGEVIYDEFYPKLSKNIIDEIDYVLAKHYGLTDEELDFIINYDIKYRMGIKD